MPQFSALQLTSVVYLGISNCPNLTSIPDGISNLTSLEELLIFHCPNLKSLPDEMVSLKSLQKLSIDDCPDLAKRCEKEIGEDCPFFSQFLLGYLKNTSPLSLDHATCNITSDLMGLIIEIYSLETLRISETDLAQAGMDEDDGLVGAIRLLHSFSLSDIASGEKRDATFRSRIGIDDANRFFDFCTTGPQELSLAINGLAIPLLRGNVDYQRKKNELIRNLILYAGSRSQLATGALNTRRTCLRDGMDEDRSLVLEIGELPSFGVA
ncbi:hypothetical protein CMV_022397 [Castanea mollissima]|uniref:Uncharacterized protein n=1 Tax=Castanea mollissima TaxID=60419 RepID=A0A8J4QWH5_9ROSI|nr:hypothetical protein CMV_022397 [Castanea mollissima]